MNGGLSIRITRLVAALLLVIAASVTAAVQQEGTPKSGNAEDPRKLLSDAVGRMQNAHRDLANGQVTQETLRNQRAIVTRLEELIAKAEQLPKSPSRTPSAGQPQPPKDPDAAPNGQPRPGDTRRSDQGPQNATNATGAANGDADATTQRRRVMVREVWGHLPPSLQKRVMNGSSVQPLPKYKRLVEKYFEAIAEQSRTKPGSPR